ncbi:MAG: membrane protein insertase YidC [Treponema sp.]|jgi:YidC/Oxa1 family membrane protein insertase|nr:membrane protein insertase YidC [Treponema sp.]
MEKNTILAVVLSAVVLLGFYFIQGIFFPPAQTTPESGTVTTAQQTGAIAHGETAPAASFTPDITGAQTSPAQTASSQALAVMEANPQTIQFVTIDTEFITVVLTNAGGDMVSWKLKEHFEDKNKEVNVEMIFSNEMILSDMDKTRAFSIALGGLNARPISDLFHVKQPEPGSNEKWVEFYRDILYPGTAEIVRLTKRYEFKPRDYMFELTVSIEGRQFMPGFNIAGNAYTLTFGPQIGPRFEKLDRYYDFRQYAAFTNGKLRKNVKLSETLDSRSSWAAISGKYFTFIAIPDFSQYSFRFSDNAEQGIPSASRLNILRSAESGSKIQDRYHFYLGPKSQDALNVYYTGKSEFKPRDTQIVEIASSSGIMAPLEKLLKWLLLRFYSIVPNYGIAIIMLTLLVKIVFFPLTKKGSEATIRMQAFAPKIKELQEKYKDNKQKLNAEMAAFYQKEGYNPISGCLPMLLQFPIFIAMYSLFNNHFDLRGAEFIPGWIPDLSVPEAIVNFPEGFSLPLLGWTALRGLPFIYVGSQLLYGKVTQMPGQQSNQQMKMMLYVMPLVFFFVLYNVPSGLLIYWIFSNLLTLVQQVIINRYVIAKKAGQGGSQPVIAPPKQTPQSKTAGSKKKRK